MEEHLQSNKEELEGRVLYSQIIDPEKLQELAQLKGQILALKEVINIEEFLSFDLERINEDEDIGPQTVIEDARSYE